MESVLADYQRFYHPDFPFVCLDEAMKQLVEETAIPIPVQPGYPERFDYQYERNGTAKKKKYCLGVSSVINKKPGLIGGLLQKMLGLNSNGFTPQLIIDRLLVENRFKEAELNKIMSFGIQAIAFLHHQS